MEIWKYDIMDIVEIWKYEKLGNSIEEYIHQAAVALSVNFLFLVPRKLFSELLQQTFVFCIVEKFTLLESLFEELQLLRIIRIIVSVYS